MDRITGVLNILTLGKEYVLFDGCARDWSKIGRFDDKLEALGLLKDREGFVFMQDYAAKTNTTYHGACKTIHTEYALEIVKHLADGDPYCRIKITWTGGSHFFRATVFKKTAFVNKCKELGMYHIFSCNNEWMWQGLMECGADDLNDKIWFYACKRWEQRKKARDRFFALKA